MLPRSIPIAAWALLMLGSAFAMAATARDSVPYIPVVIPLAVRSPYLGAYLQGSEDKNLALMSPRFWTTTPLGWKGLLRVDGEVWNWMGNLTEWPATHNESVTYTSSASTFNMTNGPRTVGLTASFLSPITPSDLFRQSLPFSYLSLTVESLDGQDHDVEVYTDINGLWLADNEQEELEWAVEELDEWSGINVRLSDQRPFQEEVWTDHSLWGDLWYAARTTDEHVQTRYAAGLHADDARQHFAETGELQSTLNSTFRRTRTRDGGNETLVIDEPVFAFSHSFKLRKGRSREDNTALLTIGLSRDPVVQYKVAGPEIVQMRPLWTSAFDDLQALVTFFLNDFEYVRKMSEAWNAKMYEDARRVHSQEYGNVLAISTRQIFAALEGVVDYSDTPLPSMNTTIPTTGGTVSTLFMLKEVSSNGNCQTIDVIAPFLPFLLYACPDLLPMLLEPTLRYSDTGLFKPTEQAVVHDLGDHYPNATGHDDYESPTLQLENTGNLLGLVLAGVRRGVPSALEQAKKYYPLLRNWASVLVRTSRWPDWQSSTDDFFGPSANQTTLTVKGIVGIRAGSEIANEIGEENDGAMFLKESARIVGHFLRYAIGRDKKHILGHYGNESSWHGQYNLYYDRLLALDAFPNSIYEMQDAFYPTVTQDYGPALDSAFPDRSKTDWLGWLAACSRAGSEARDMFVYALSNYTRQLKNHEFGDYITPSGGWSVGFQTRPVVGGHFALLGLDVMNRIRAGGYVEEDLLDLYGDNDDDDVGLGVGFIEHTKQWAQDAAAKAKQAAADAVDQLRAEGNGARIGGLTLLAIGMGIVATTLYLKLRGSHDESSKGVYDRVDDDERRLSPAISTLVISREATPMLAEGKGWNGSQEKLLNPQRV